MQTHPDTLGALATEQGRVRQAEATRERHLAQARGGAGGLRAARGPLATALVALAAVLFFVSADQGSRPNHRPTTPQRTCPRSQVPGAGALYGIPRKGGQLPLSRREGRPIRPHRPTSAAPAP